MGGRDRRHVTGGIIDRLLLRRRAVRPLIIEFGIIVLSPWFPRIAKNQLANITDYSGKRFSVNTKQKY